MAKSGRWSRHSFWIHTKWLGPWKSLMPPLRKKLPVANKCLRFVHLNVESKVSAFSETLRPGADSRHVIHVQADHLHPVHWLSHLRLHFLSLLVIYPVLLVPSAKYIIAFQILSGLPFGVSGVSECSSNSKVRQVYNYPRPVEPAASRIYSDGCFGVFRQLSYIRIFRLCMFCTECDRVWHRGGSKEDSYKTTSERSLRQLIGHVALSEAWEYTSETSNICILESEGFSNSFGFVLYADVSL